MPGPVRIGIWTGGHDLTDAGISFLTHGKGTHAAFIRGNGRIAENFYPRVRERDFEPGERERVEVYYISGTGPADWARLEKWIDHELAHPRPYSIVDLFRYALNLPPHPGRGGFCSMWVLRGCRLNLGWRQQPLVRLRYPDYGSPRDIRMSPLLVPE